MRTQGHRHGVEPGRGRHRGGLAVTIGDPGDGTGLLRLGQLAGNGAVARVLGGQVVAPVGVRLPVQREHVLPEDQKAAADRLAERFPGIMIDGKLDERDDAFWAKYMTDSGRPRSLVEFVESLLGGLLGEPQRAGVRIMLFTEPGGSSADMSAGIRVVVSTQAPLSDADKRPFSLTQVYRVDGGRLTVHVETVVAPKLGRQFVRSSLLTEAATLNAKMLTLSASSIGGSQEGVFAWARYGFVPTTDDWNKMRRWGLAKLKQEELAAVREAGAGDILLDADPKAVRRLVHLAWQKGGEVTKFLNNVLSSNFSWRGELDLTDEKSRKWIEAYASDEQASFDALLPEASAVLTPPPQEVSTPPPQEVSGKPDEPDASTTDSDDEQTITSLVAAIKEGNGSLEDLEEEYESRPEIIKAVRARAALENK
jgi:hypothetical protein